jgi:hypothetical protein
MKKIATYCVAAALILLMGTANAAVSGAYVGASVGYSTSNAPKITDDIDSESLYDYRIIDSSVASNGLAGRVFVGYNFNPYLGLELGLARYADLQYKYSVVVSGPGESAQYNEKDTYNFVAADLLGKAYLPIGESGVSLYALGGAAGVFVRTESASNDDAESESSYLSDAFGDTLGYTVLRPKFGVGASYAINQSISTNLEFSRIQGKGNLGDNDYVPNLDMTSLSLTYHID